MFSSFGIGEERISASAARDPGAEAARRARSKSGSAAPVRGTALLNEQAACPKRRLSRQSSFFHAFCVSWRAEDDSNSIGRTCRWASNLALRRRNGPSAPRTLTLEEGCYKSGTLAEMSAACGVTRQAIGDRLGPRADFSAWALAVAAGDPHCGLALTGRTSAPVELPRD